MVTCQTRHPRGYATTHDEPLVPPPPRGAAAPSNKSSSEDALAMSPRASVVTTLPSAAERTITDGIPRTVVAVGWEWDTQGLALENGTYTQRE